MCSRSIIMWRMRDEGTRLHKVCMTSKVECCTFTSIFEFLLFYRVKSVKSKNVDKILG